MAAAAFRSIDENRRLLGGGGGKNGEGEGKAAKKRKV